MKSVTLSEVVRVRNPALHWSPLARYVLTLALGLPAIIGAFSLLDPSAPLPCIALPVLAGGLLPALALLPGRLEVTTRFEARHMVGTLDATLAALGFARAGQQQGAVRYRTRSARWLRKEVALTVREHAIELVGPVDTLRALRSKLAC